MTDDFKSDFECHFECAFALPDGYCDGRGDLHREGRMRLATARDELRALSDFRVHLRPEALVPVLLALVITRLGELSRVDFGVVDRMSERDRAHLERLYKEFNGYGPEGFLNDG